MKLSAVIVILSLFFTAPFRTNAEPSYGAGSCTGVTYLTGGGTSSSCAGSTATIGDNSCTGDYRSCDGTSGNIGSNSCKDEYSCASSNGNIGDNSCHNSQSCQENKAQIGNNSCNDETACLYSIGNIGDSSCNDYRSCEDNEVQIGNNSCNNEQSCFSAESPIGDNSCNAIGSCNGTLTQIGDNSCNDDYACELSAAQIGDNSCNSPEVCSECRGPVPNGVCNEGTDRDATHFDQDNKCKWCNPTAHENFLANYASGPSNTGSGGGDPHFKTFFDIVYSWHGGCDAVFLRSIKLGIEIHIRTTRIQRKTGSYSVISAVGGRIGSDFFEVNDDALLTLNGAVVLHDDATTSASSSPTLTLPSGLRFSKAMQGTKHRIVVYNIDVGDGMRSFQIRVNLKSRVINLDATGPFEDGQGLMGSTSSKALLGRDGVTDFSTAFNSLGTDWQVRQYEEKLFKDKDRFPQDPIGCIYDGAMMNADHADNHLRGHGRRLSDEEEKLTIEDANYACAHVGNAQKKEFCIVDVLALNDLDLAEDPFYAN